VAAGRQAGVPILGRVNDDPVATIRGAACNHSGSSESLDMRVKSSLALYASEQLTFLGRISNRAIFGGVGIFCDDRLLGIVYDEVLYLHTDKSNLADYESRGMPQFKPYPNAFDLTTDHHQVPSDIVQDPQQLKLWAQRSLTASIEAARAKQLAGIERTRGQKRAKRKKRHT